MAWRDSPLGVKLVILKSAIFGSDRSFFENHRILNLAGSRRTHDSFNLRFRHAGRHFFIRTSTLLKLSLTELGFSP